MGQAVAMRLKACGFEVFAALDRRSARTRELAGTAGVADCGAVSELVATCDVILSILNPAAAAENAREVARAMSATGKTPLYVDCNAIAPETGRHIEEIIRASGGAFVDGGIIGPPPRGKAV